MAKVIAWLSLVALALLVHACLPSENALCPATELILEVEAFPVRTEPGQITTPLPDGPRSSAGRTFYLEEGIANHNIYPFSSISRASSKFDYFQNDPDFSNASSGWRVPTDLEKLKLRADQYQLRCGEQHEIPMCKLIAQYGPYFVYFNIHTYSGTVTFSDVGSLVNEIDSLMTGCLETQEN